MQPESVLRPDGRKERSHVTHDDVVSELALFDVAPPPAITLRDAFVMPPFTVLDRRQGEWQRRRNRWLSLGIDSSKGRDANLAYNFGNVDMSTYQTAAWQFLLDRNGGTSIFDPVVCELVYRWFSAPRARVLDPYAGGSVRGLVAALLERQYTGIDIREEQLAENYDQFTKVTETGVTFVSGCAPQWRLGDATKLNETLPPDDMYDLVLSCPPYFDKEVYSEHPRDISTWNYEDFVDGYKRSITDAVAHLLPDRYAVWVVGDVRDKHGGLRGLPHLTVETFRSAGLHVLNECVIVDPTGSACVRAGSWFEKNRKMPSLHQHLIVFVKGDIKKASMWAQSIEER